MDSDPRKLRVPDYCIEQEILHDYAEEYKNNLDAFQAFTWTPDPKKYRSSDPQRQWEDLLVNVLTSPQMEYTFNVFVFVPEINQNGNIHVHGYYNVDDHVKYNRWFLPACKTWGYTYIKKKVDTKWMIDYLQKEIDITTKVVSPLHSIIAHDRLTAIRIDMSISNIMKVKHTPQKRVVRTKKGILKYF